MAKISDHLMKILTKANRQHLVSLVLPGAVYVSELASGLEVQSRAIEPDVLYNITWEGQEGVLHVEIQRRHDSDMGKRSWEYNSITSFLTQKPVWTFVIYLLKDSGIVEPPYQKILPDGNTSHIFFYTNIKLWELPRQTFKQPGLEGLLPLVPLTQDGAQRSAIEEMIADLQAAQKQDLLPLAYAFAALIFEKTDDKEWLERRFKMLHDILEESWAYQEMVREASTMNLLKGIQEGLQQGLEKGMEQGLQQSARETLERYVELRFPSLVPLLEREINGIDDHETLQRLLFDLFVARTTGDAESMILHVNG